MGIDPSDRPRLSPCVLPCVWVLPFTLAIGGQAGAQVGESGDVEKRLEKQMRQFDETSRFEVPPNATISERLLLDWGASARAALYGIDDADSHEHVLRQYDGRAWLRADLDGMHRFYARLKFQYDDFNEGQDFDGQGDDLREPIGERWWYEFDLLGAKRAREGDRSQWNVDAKVGKQFIQWGSGLALSTALIAAQLELAVDAFAFDLLLGDTPPNDTVDFDASRPHFDSNTRRRFFGAMVEARGGDHLPYAYALVQKDRNIRDYTLYRDTLGQLFPTLFDYNSEYYGVGMHGSLGGQWSYQSEFSFEAGHGRSSPIARNGGVTAQTWEEIRAWAAELELAYLARDDHKTRTDVELIVASGDDDRLDGADTFGGNLTGTRDHAFNSLGFAQTGLALAPDPGNLATLRLGTATSPFNSSSIGGGGTFDRLRLLLDGYAFVKLDMDAPINVGTDHHRYVGTELDVGVDWALLSDVTFNLRAGFFLPGSAMASGENRLRKFLFGSVTYAF